MIGIVYGIIAVVVSFAIVISLVNMVRGIRTPVQKSNVRGYRFR